VEILELLAVLPLLQAAVVVVVTTEAQAQMVAVVLAVLVILQVAVVVVMVITAEVLQEEPQQVFHARPLAAVQELQEMVQVQLVEQEAVEVQDLLTLVEMLELAA
jgi:glucan phosphoethanolaminetransferase (alkaline phosphatase superfamily)